MDRIGTGDHGFSWCASSVDTGASELVSLDKCHRLASRSESACQRRAGLTSSDNDCVKYFHVMSSLLNLGRAHNSAVPSHGGITHRERSSPKNALNMSSVSMQS
jgi:hypothetical protein